MTNRRRQRSHGSSGILSKDPFGLIWLAIIYLAIMIAKWWYISPAKPEDNNCVACVVAVIWLLSILLFVGLALFWVLWTKKYEKGPVFVFFLFLACLILTIADFYVLHFVIGKLFYGGMLNWQESQASYLIDVFVPHSVALLLVCSVFYTVIRVLMCRDLSQPALVYTVSAILLLTVVPLSLLGLILY